MIHMYTIVLLSVSSLFTNANLKPEASHVQLVPKRRSVYGRRQCTTHYPGQRFRSAASPQYPRFQQGSFATGNAATSTGRNESGPQPPGELVPVLGGSWIHRAANGLDHH